MTSSPSKLFAENTGDLSPSASVQRTPGPSPDPNERIAQLEEEVRLLREKVELVRYLSPACPACQGKMTRSTKFQDLICLQEFGPCGMLEFGVKSRAPRVYASFTRTRLKGGTLTVDITRLYPKNIRLRKFYIADVEVSEEEYLSKFKPKPSPTLDSALTEEKEQKNDN